VLRGILDPSLGRGCRDFCYTGCIILYSVRVALHPDINAVFPPDRYFVTDDHPTQRPDCLDTILDGVVANYGRAKLVNETNTSII